MTSALCSWPHNKSHLITFDTSSKSRLKSFIVSSLNFYMRSSTLTFKLQFVPCLKIRNGLVQVWGRSCWKALLCWPLWVVKLHVSSCTCDHSRCVCDKGNICCLFWIFIREPTFHPFPFSPLRKLNPCLHRVTSSPAGRPPSLSAGAEETPPYPTPQSVRFGGIKSHSSS